MPYAVLQARRNDREVVLGLKEIMDWKPGGVWGGAGEEGQRENPTYTGIL